MNSILWMISFFIAAAARSFSRQHFLVFFSLLFGCQFSPESSFTYLLPYSEHSSYSPPLCLSLSLFSSFFSPSASVISYSRLKTTFYFPTETIYFNKIPVIQKNQMN